MCGILGITGKQNALAEEALKTFSYRGPDATAVLSDERATLGHNRLSIIDLDKKANQPMSGADDTLRIVFNGEIYNYKEIRSELEKKGHKFHTKSDTEVLIYAYKEWGKEMVTRLRGMYAIAIHDRGADKLILFTDYSNMKPIFYATVGGSFAFSSELKGIVHMLKKTHVPVEVDKDSLDLYWALGYVPTPRTIYRGISRMPRRTILTVELKTGEFSEVQYGKPSVAAPTEDNLKALIEKKVEQHLIADVPVGLFFSGGTDSSVIAAVLKKLGVRLEAFSLEISARPEDREYFEKIAQHMDLSIHKSFFGPKEFDEIYPTVSKFIDEPFADSSLFPTYFISREAAKKVKVVLSGDGGDEYFLGYPRSVVLSRMAKAPLDGEMTWLDALYIKTPRFRKKVGLFEKLFAIFRQPISYYLLTMSPTKDFLNPVQWKAAKRVLASRTSAPISLDADNYLENDLLRKADLATMYNSIEGRIPLLDPDVTAAAETAMRSRVPLKEKKPLLKKILATYLPPELVYRGKRGFGLDMGVFFSESKVLKGELEAALAFLALKEILPSKELLPLPELTLRRPQLCWQILMLYHAIKNAGI